MNNSFKYFNPAQLRDYSSLFSRSSVLEWMKGDLSSIDRKVERYDQNWISNTNKTYLNYLKYIYKILEENYSNEYVVKNSFLNEWLIKEVGETNSQIFSEFRLGKAIADLAMFNGLSKAFEIKTELDNDKRLEFQLEQYQNIFNEIYLIIPASKYKLYKNINNQTGIILYDTGKKERFCLERKAKTEYWIDPKALMHIFHTEEYKNIVRKYYGQLPDMTSFDQFKKCSKLIEQIPNHELNKLFIQQIKRRKDKKVLSNRYHLEFNQISLALKLNRENKKLLFDSLKSKING